ncbi:MAG: glycoside hydrolase domain-containing protein [Streptosporangiaceae bacterium]
MRRAAMAVVIVGLIFGEIVSGPGQQPAAVAASLTIAANTVKVSKSAEKTVTFDGYSASVPASWPVYDLAKDPRQCVRYDIHAVYLGNPAPDQDQDCPPGLIGRVGTISIGSVPETLETPQSLPVEQWAGDRKAPARTSPQAPAAGTIIQDPDLHELVLAMPNASPPVGATYGTDPGSTERILATVRPDGIRRAPAVRGVQPSALPRPGDSIRGKGPWPLVTTPPAGVPPGWLPPSDQSTGPVPAPPPTPGRALAGFDTCGAPSLPTMKAWRAKYAAAAIYIGGQMMGCGQSNLSASWVQQARAMGWSLMPTFVGLQAPCNSFSGEINPSQAASQGTAAAGQAAAAAAAYGLGAGSPIYYDMEAYDNTDAGCRTAVLTFLDAWSRQLEARHYVPGLYSSAASGIVDVQSATTIAGHPMAKPEAVWFALWDDVANLNGTGYLTSAVWPLASRSKQYQGNVMVTVGGISLDVDADLVDSAVVPGATGGSPSRTG